MNAPLARVAPALPVGTPTLPLNAVEGQFLYLPPDWITVQPDFNPRTFFEDAEFTALVDSVTQHGVQQALWVRPAPDYDPAVPRFWLIAGERRLRAACAVGLPTVPISVRLADDRQAHVLADLENNPHFRVNLSAAEEARFAQRFVGECEGDRVEAARLLGWSPTKLDARLLLLHAVPAVLDALTQRRIKLGHAELLAGLPEATQIGTLAKILSDAISVAALKARLSGFALDLSAAIFDKTDCTTCPHHSTRQAALFAEALGEGRCQNRACHAEKTRQALLAKKADLEATYPSVFLDTERAPTTWTRLSATGPTGVGAAQFAACQTCRAFAARLSSQPGQEGVVEAPLCTDLTCHREKLTTAHPVAVSSPREVAPSVRQGTAPPPPPQVAGSPKKVETWIDGWLRHQAAEAVRRDPDLLAAWELAALYREAGAPTAVLTEVGLTDPAPLRRHAGLIAAFYPLTTDQKQHLRLALVQHLVRHRDANRGDLPGQSETVQAAQTALAVAGTDLTAAFIPDAAFWGAQTKAAIEGLLRSAGSPQGETFAQWYGRTQRQSATDAKAFDRLVNSKLADLMAVLERTTFDFSAWLPEAIAKRVQRPAS